MLLLLINFDMNLNVTHFYKFRLQYHLLFLTKIVTKSFPEIQKLVSMHKID